MFWVQSVTWVTVQPEALPTDAPPDSPRSTVLQLLKASTLLPDIPPWFHARGKVKSILSVPVNAPSPVFVTEKARRKSVFGATTPLVKSLPVP